MKQVERYVDRVVEQIKPGKKVAGNKDWSTEIATAKNEVPSHTRTYTDMYVYTYM
jgi:hypothetical protein